jgi:nitric oxide reductase activation protein
LSDGMPGSTNYDDEYAIRHTKDQVNEMRKNGLHVISYFVSDRDLNDYYARIWIGNFKRMYGQDSRIVNVESVTEIANTMNAKFLTPKG